MEKRNSVPQQPQQMFNPMPEYLGDPGAGNVAPESLRTTPLAQQNKIPLTPPNVRERANIDNTVATTMTQKLIDEEIMNEQIAQDINNIQSDSNFNVPKNAKDVLKSIISSGIYHEDVEIMGNMWTLKALSQRDILAAFNEVKEDNETIIGRVNALSFAQIIYSVEAVNGISIYDWFPEIEQSKFFNTEAYEFAVRRAILRYFERMPNRVINKFIEQFNKIEEKRNEAIDELKNS